MVKPSMARIFFILFLTLALAITVGYRETFFSTSYYEEGDDASNALQIHRAKQFRELHGNYSRFNFHHPGPAFFYVYALGEVVLTDLTAIAPAPHNARLYTGVLIQLAFFAAAVALLARHSRQPGLTIALTLVAAALNYAQVDGVLYSVWPPYVLLMPFLCFVVACAAVFNGDRSALPVFVIAGGFLVHGHIAQPLFVLPMALLAVLGARRAWGTAWRTQLTSRAGLVAGGLLGIFLLPLVLDLFAGRDSNFHDVLRHMRHGSSSGQNLLQSILFYGAYFLGLKDPSIFNDITAQTLVPFREGAWRLGLWLVLGVFAAGSFFRRSASAQQPGEIRFGRGLLWFWLVASALTLVWGMRQDDGFTSYNSHFNYSLILVLALAAIVALGQLLPTLPRALAASGILVALPVFAFSLPHDPWIGSRGDELTVRLRALIEADPLPAAPKLIVIGERPGKVAAWYEAVTLARAFQRLGIEFYVHPRWRWMFGDDKVFHGQAELSKEGGPSIWKVVDLEEAPPGAHVLNSMGAVIFPVPAPLALPATLDYTLPGNHASYNLFGFSEPEEKWTWTEASVAALAFAAPKTERAIELTLEASALLTRLNPHGQRTRIFVNNVAVGEMTFGEAPQHFSLKIAPDIWNRRSPQRIIFELPDAMAPAVAGGSGDTRVLGLQFYKLTLSPVGL